MSGRTASAAGMEKVCTLSPKLLFAAYSQGYFPMPDEETQQISWYRPDPRAIMPLNGFRVSRSLRRTMRRAAFQVTYSQAFDQVIAGCADREETWINRQIREDYQRLHRLQAAQSVEIWQDDRLVGGVYGVNFGGAFFAESMFHKVTDASKVALYYLVERLKERQFELLEVQFMTDHLASLGAIEIPDFQYMPTLKQAIAKDTHFI